MTTAVDPVVAEAGRRTPRHHFWHGLRVVILRRPSRVAGALICALFAFLAVFGPYLYPANLPIDPTAIFQGPSAAHWLGTDFEGTDVLALLITGTRYVLEAAAFASLFTVVIGTTVGLVAGYHRGLSDSTLMKVTDFVLTIPGFPLLIVLSTVWDFGAPWSMGLVLGVTGWGGLARAVRSQTLSLRERGFIEAARGLDLSALHIVFRELLPNVAPCIAMSLLLTFTGFVYAEVGLFFLGVVPFTVNNWGVMLNLAIQNGALSSTSALSYLLAPLVAILLLTLGVVLVLDAFDELFNPRLREG